MDSELGQMVYSAANAVVGAMATDGWGTVKARLGRWLKQHRRADADEVLDRLEELRSELMRSRQEPDPERFWSLYEELQAALAVRLATVSAGDRTARLELERLRAEWMGVPAVAGQAASSSEHLARAYGELLVGPSGSLAAAAVPVRVERGSGGPVVNLAPPTTARFIDREELLARLHEQIVSGERRIRIVNLHGVGGIGKTALALKVWELVASSFPHGLLYADLRGSTGESAVEPGVVLERFLRAFKIEAGQIPGDEEARLDLLRNLTADLAVVVLLDDAASAAQARPLISASAQSLTIVTSRDPLRSLVQEYGATVMRVPPLDDANSVRLLRAVAGLDESETDSTSGPGPGPDELEARARRCAGIPVAVCIEGARLAVGDAAEPSEHSQPESAGADLLAVYRDLPPELVRLHRLLSAHPWPSVAAGPAAAAAGVQVETAAVMLDRLYRANLLERAAGSSAGLPRYRVENAVREAAARQLGTTGDAAEVVEATRAIVSWYLTFAVRADWEVIPRWHLGPLYRPLEQERREAGSTGRALPARYPDRHAALAALEAEFENLVEAVRAADRHMFHELTSQLCEAMWSVLFRRGHTDEWIAVHRLGVDAARKSGDLTMEARMHVQLAFGLMAQDRLADAEQEFTLGLAAARAAGHDQGQATALESLGLLLLGRESFDRAAELFAEARTVAERVGDPRALALLEHHYGRALGGLGRFEEASLQFDRALAAFRALTIRDEYNEGRILMSRAEAALRAGRPEQAGEVLADAARIMAAEDSLVMQAQVAVLRAWCARESADLVAERLFLVQAQELHRRAGSRLTPRVSERITFLDAARTRLS